MSPRACRRAERRCREPRSCAGRPSQQHVGLPLAKTVSTQRATIHCPRRTSSGARARVGHRVTRRNMVFPKQQNKGAVPTLAASQLRAPSARLPATHAQRPMSGVFLSTCGTLSASGCCPRRSARGAGGQGHDGRSLLPHTPQSRTEYTAVS